MRTFSQNRAQARRMIALVREWRSQYQQLRRIGWDSQAARELANIAVAKPPYI